jgi:hypothetical protein
VHVRNITVSLGALALTITIAGCSAAAKQGQAPSTTPNASTSAPAATATVAPTAGVSGIVTPGTSPTPAAAAPSPSATACFTPDIAGDNATAARSAVQTAGFQVAVVTKADPDEPSFPGGLVWGGNPPLDETRAPCGSTVTVYIQPGTTP